MRMLLTPSFKQAAHPQEIAVVRCSLPIFRNDCAQHPWIDAEWRALLKRFQERGRAAPLEPLPDGHSEALLRRLQ